MPRMLPRWMHEKHGAFYLVRQNKWHRLAGNLHDALVEYARLTATAENGEWGELVLRAFDDMKKTIAKTTAKNYATCYRRVLKSFEAFTPQQIKPKDIAYFLDLNKDHPSMANLLHSFLNNVFTRAVRWGVVEANPVRDIKKFKVGGRDRLITDAEWHAIRSNASATMQSLMDIAYVTGQRIGDVMAIKYSDISAAGLFVKQGKTGARRLIQMTPDLAKAIETARAIHISVRGLTLFHKTDGSPVAYGTMHHHWLKACEAAKVEDANFHDIRAGSATYADEAGMDSKGLLGHTTESSHNRYLRSKSVKKVSPVPMRKS